MVNRPTRPNLAIIERQLTEPLLSKHIEAGNGASVAVTVTKFRSQRITKLTISADFGTRSILISPIALRQLTNALIEAANLNG